MAQALRNHFDRGDLLCGFTAATLLSGIPSTVYAFFTGRDVLEATLAAGSMVLPDEIAVVKLVTAAALVHCAVSLFWSVALVVTLPHRHFALWSVAASIGIAVFDLLIVAPLLFPRIAALEFWPQFADHIMWGASFGLAIESRRRRKSKARTA